jgi:hypothetical protein
MHDYPYMVWPTGMIASAPSRAEPSRGRRLRAVVGLGPVAQHRRLDVVELHGDGAARKLASEAVDEWYGVLLTGHCDQPAHRDSLTDWRGHAPQTVPVVALVADLVQEFVHRLTDALEPTDVCHRQIRMGNVPAFCCDLVAGEVVFRLRAANPRPAFESTIQDI